MLAVSGRGAAVSPRHGAGELKYTSREHVRDGRNRRRVQRNATPAACQRQNTIQALRVRSATHRDSQKWWAGELHSMQVLIPAG